MPDSSFKRKATEFGAGVERHPCGQTFEYTSERDMKMKLRILCRFCSNPPVAIDKIRVPKKACTLREQQLNEVERMRKVHSEPCGLGTLVHVPNFGGLSGSEDRGGGGDNSIQFINFGRVGDKSFEEWQQK